MFSTFSRVMLRDTHGEPGLSVVLSSNQTSKFTRRLGNVLTSLHKHVKGSKASNVYGFFSKKSIEKFLWDNDCDLFQYVGEFREKRVPLNIVCAVSGRRFSFSL